MPVGRYSNATDGVLDLQLGCFRSLEKHCTDLRNRTPSQILQLLQLAAQTVKFILAPGECKKMSGRAKEIFFAKLLILILITIN